MAYPYLFFLLVFFAIPLAILSYWLRDDIRKYPRTLMWSFVFVYTLGIVWDWLSVQTGVWRYTSAPTLGIWVDGLPAEEFIGFYVLGTGLIIAVIFATLRLIRT